MTIVAVILAGGASQRMGQEKASMYGGVNRIERCLADAGIQRCVVLCGDEGRTSMFEGEVFADPPHLRGLHQIIPWIRDELGASILLVPCDAFLLSSEAIKVFLAASPTGGVPTDEEGRRQPLFAHLPVDVELNNAATSVSTLLEGLPTVDVVQHRSAFSNFNRPSDLQHPQLSNRRL
jgi:molybdopterin-guanine dinucleotide biosynthesis protein A